MTLQWQSTYVAPMPMYSSLGLGGGGRGDGKHSIVFPLSSISPILTSRAIRHFLHYFWCYTECLSGTSCTCIVSDWHQVCCFLCLQFLAVNIYIAFFPFFFFLIWYGGGFCLFFLLLLWLLPCFKIQFSKVAFSSWLFHFIESMYTSMFTYNPPTT